MKSKRALRGTLRPSTSRMASVFVSYSRDPPDSAHTQRVARLVASLRQDKVIVYCDQIEDDRVEGLVSWKIWAEGAFRDADRVLLVCDELYARKLRGEVPPNTGQGVQFEYTLVCNNVGKIKPNSSKVIPVVFTAEETRFIPEILEDSPSRIVLDEPGAYRRLYALLTRQRLTRFPEEGETVVRLKRKDVVPLFQPVADIEAALEPQECARTPQPEGPRRALRAWSVPPDRRDVRGLDWYEECDAGHFRGRQEDTTTLMSLLLFHPLVRLVGPSGMGKSSLLRAGLLPALREPGWRACVVRPFEDPGHRLRGELFAGLLARGAGFSAPFDAAKFRAEVSPLLAEAGVSRLFLLIDQFEDVVSPNATSDAVEVMRAFLQELWNERDARPRFHAVVSYRTEAEARLGRLWQQISGRSEGLPYHSLGGLAPDATEAIITETSGEQGWALEARVPDLARQLVSESRKHDAASREVFPVYLQIVLRQAQTADDGRLTAAFLGGKGGVAGLIGSYLDDTLARLEERGGQWRQCHTVLEVLSRTSGTKAAQSLGDLVRESGLSRAVLGEMLPALIEERLVRPVGDELYEIQHDQLAAAVVSRMEGADREAKSAREFLSTKTTTFARTRTPLSNEELVHLYRHRHRIHPTEPELQLILTSLQKPTAERGGYRGERPGVGWFWLRRSTAEDWMNRLIALEVWRDGDRAFRSPTRDRSYVRLGDVPLDGLAPYAIRLAGESSPAARIVAATLLGRSGHTAHIPLLESLAGAAHWGVCQRAVQALAGIGPEASASLKQLLGKGDHHHRSAIALTLVEAGYPDMVPSLTKLANESVAANVGHNVVKALAVMKSDEALPLLRRMVKHRDQDVRKQAMLALASFGRFEDLLRLRSAARSEDDEDWQVRPRALTALSRHRDAKAIPFFLALSSDKDRNLRRAATQALAGIAGPEARAAMIQLARDPDAKVRTAAIEGLASSGGPEILSLAIDARADEDPRVRVAALEVLVTREVPGALRSLCELARTNVGALEAVVRRGRGEAESWLAELARDAEESIRLSAVTKLGAFGGPNVVEILATLVEDEQWPVRREVAKALGAAGRPESITLLVEMARRAVPRAEESDPERPGDEGWDVHSAALEAISRYGAAGVAALRELAAHPNSSVRFYVAQTLAGMEPALARPPLRPLTGDSDTSVRAQAIVALAKFEPVTALAFKEITDAQEKGEFSPGFFITGGRAALPYLASLCARDDLEAFLNRHEQSLSDEVLLILDEALYMPVWLKLEPAATAAAEADQDQADEEEDRQWLD